MLGFRGNGKMLRVKMWNNLVVSKFETSEHQHLTKKENREEKEIGAMTHRLEEEPSPAIMICKFSRLDSGQ